MNLRTLSHAIKIWVKPEIERRLNLKLIDMASLPINLTAFQFIQWKKVDGTLVQEVELNDEVSRNVIVKLREGVAVEAGQELLLSQIEEEKTTIPFPIREGRKTSFFRAERLYLQFLFTLDMTPNLHEQPDVTDADGVPFDIRGYVAEVNAIVRMDPAAWMTELASNNWPPSQGCFPTMTQALANGELRVGGAGVYDLARQIFTQEYFERQIELWKEFGVLGSREKYFRHIVERHFARDFISSVHVIAPLFEGIIDDILVENAVKASSKQDLKLRRFKEILYSRKVLTFPPSLIDSILFFLEKGTLWKPSSKVVNPSGQVNRHGIAHGKFRDFETEELSLKFLMLLDALCFLILHDRVASGALIPELNDGTLLKGMLLSRVDPPPCTPSN